MWAAVCKNGDFFAIAARITWKEDRWVYAARGLASTELSFHHATYCVIIAGASPGETKMWAVVRENSDF